MEVEVHEFDPEGDLFLLFTRQPLGEEGDNFDQVESILPENTKPRPLIAEVLVGDSEDSVTTVATPPIEPELIENDFPEAEIELPAEVRLLVSSRHMRLVSPVFKAMLQSGNFKEGRELSSAGKVEVSLPDDDPDAFIIIMDIIHGRNRRVPKVIDMETLIRIAMLVDKYQMVEAVEAFSDMWIEKLKRDMPPDHYQPVETGQWLGISWVFGKGEEFKVVTMNLERHALAPWYDRGYRYGGLPVPDIIFETIQKKRLFAISSAFGFVEDIVKRYQKGVHCSRTDSTLQRNACDSMVLGSVLRSAIKKGVYPVPAAPYETLSFSRLAEKLRTMKPEALCDSISRPESKEVFGVPVENPAVLKAHGLKTSIKEKVKTLEDGLCGLDLEDFQVKKKT